MFVCSSVIDSVLSVVPRAARACYTGQSILAYCPNPTFTWEEVNLWESATDIDIFAYTQTSHAAIVQAYISAGYEPATPIDEFKAERIRFFNPSKRFNLQTVCLKKDDLPVVNVSWRKGDEDAISVITGFDMDYLMVSMDLRTGVFVDLRGPDTRVANINKYNGRFDPYDVEPSYWYRQFERVPKGWSRGIDTRPVARQYARWIKDTIEKGDRSLYSKTREYADRAMKEAIAPVIETGFSEEEAEALYHLMNGETHTWEAQLLKHTAMLERIETWLAGVEDAD